MEGIPQEMLGDPRGLATYRYSRNTPTSYSDQSGRTLSPVDGALFVVDVNETLSAGAAWGRAVGRFASNPSFATYASGTVLGIGFANAAIAAVAGTVLPGGGGAKAANVATRATAESVEKAVKEITGQADDVIGAVASTAEDFHLPGDVPNDFSVVKGGTKPPPDPGTTFSGSFGATMADAAAGVPHGQIQPSTAGQIRAGGGTVEVAPEMTGSTMNYQHVNVTEGSAPTSFGPPEPNPVPKSERIGGPDYGQ
jgi:hypothetical protein